MTAFVRLLLIASLAAPVAAQTPDDRLQGAGSHEYIWLAIADAESEAGAELSIHASEMDEAALQSVLQLTRMPGAMAAYGDRLWLVYPVEPISGDDVTPRRPVFTLQVEHNSVYRSYETTPAGRLEPLASLPGVGRVGGMLGTPDGPVVALLPGSGPPDPEDERFGLFELRRERWERTPLPALVADERFVAVVGVGAEVTPRLLVASRVAGAVLDLDDHGTWTRTTLETPIDRVVATTTVGEHAVLALDTSDTDSLVLVYLRPGGVLPLATVPRPDGLWTLQGLADGPRLLATRGASVTLQVIDGTSGEFHEPVTMTTVRPRIGPVVLVTIIWAAAMVAMLAILLLRPGAREIRLPQGVGIVGPIPRLLALLIDLVPSALLTIAILRCPLSDLMRLPVLTPDLVSTGPYLMMVGITVAHSMLSEAVTGRSLGKAVTGARVVTLAGEPVPLGRLILRNLVKSLSLALPPLLLIALVSPAQQGLGDQIARTVVVVRKEPLTPGD